MLGFSAFTVIAFWGFRNPTIYPFISNALDLAILAVALGGACVGLPLVERRAGAGSSWATRARSASAPRSRCLALTTNTSLLLPIVGAPLRDRDGSVVLQVGSFRLFDKRRIFRMAPIHHHFELGGWPETTVDRPLLDPRRHRAPRWPSACSTPTSSARSAWRDAATRARLRPGRHRRGRRPGAGGPRLAASRWPTTGRRRRASARRGRARRRAGRGADAAHARRALVGRRRRWCAEPRRCPSATRCFAVAADAGVPVRCELDLAAAWERPPGGPRRGRRHRHRRQDDRPRCWRRDARGLADGARSPPATPRCPLVEAIDDPTSTCSWSRLVVPAGLHRALPAEAAAWLNLAPDHLDWHRSMDGYEAAKARIWAHQRPTDVAVGNADDPVVHGPPRAGARPPRHVRRRRRPTSTSTAAGWSRPGRARWPTWPTCAAPLPHDVANALAAAARRAGGRAWRRSTASRPALAGFTAPPHRVELVAEAGGVRWYDDSKATTPHAAVTAIRGFDSVVLIAGGRNKGLDLAAAGRRGDARPRRRRHRRGGRRGRGGVRRRRPVRSRRRRRWTTRSTWRRRPGRRRATRCCCRRAAPASTGTGLRRAGRRLRPRSSTSSSGVER